MLIVVDRGSAEPVYGQIARQIREHIAAERLVPGAALPAVRSVATDLGVNLNTVARAYRILEDEGFIRIRERAGAEILAPARRIVSAERGPLLDELGHLLSRMRQAGFSADELRRAATRAIDALPGAHGGP